TFRVGVGGDHELHGAVAGSGTAGGDADPRGVAGGVPRAARGRRDGDGHSSADAADVLARGRNGERAARVLPDRERLPAGGDRSPPLPAPVGGTGRRASAVV